MPVYNHYNETKKAHPELPMLEKVGACLTCTYWQADAPRPVSETAQVALCIHPQLKEYALIVSGSSACNKWQKKEGGGEEAHAYAEQGKPA